MKSKNERKEPVNAGMCLVVKSPFREYKRGDRIHDEAEMSAILGCHEEHMVNKAPFNYE